MDYSIENYVFEDILNGNVCITCKTEDEVTGFIEVFKYLGLTVINVLEVNIYSVVSSLIKKDIDRHYIFSIIQSDGAIVIKHLNYLLKNEPFHIPNIKQNYKGDILKVTKNGKGIKIMVLNNYKSHQSLVNCCAILGNPREHKDERYIKINNHLTADMQNISCFTVEELKRGLFQLSVPDKIVDEIKKKYNF